MNITTARIVVASEARATHGPPLSVKVLLIEMSQYTAVLITNAIQGVAI
jgi:hypothetical protein